MKMPNIFEELEGKGKGKTNTKQQKAKLYKCCVFFGKLFSFYSLMSSLIFDPVSVPRKREREQRLRICKITSVKGKRKIQEQTI